MYKLLYKFLFWFKKDVSSEIKDMAIDIITDVDSFWVKEYIDHGETDHELTICHENKDKLNFHIRYTIRDNYDMTREYVLYDSLELSTVDKKFLCKVLWNHIGRSYVHGFHDDYRRHKLNIYKKKKGLK